MKHSNIYLNLEKNNKYDKTIFTLINSKIEFSNVPIFEQLEINKNKVEYILEYCNYYIELPRNMDIDPKDISISFIEIGFLSDYAIENKGNLNLSKINIINNQIRFKNDKNYNSNIFQGNYINGYLELKIKDEIFYSPKLSVLIMLNSKYNQSISNKEKIFINSIKDMINYIYTRDFNILNKKINIREFDNKININNSIDILNLKVSLFEKIYDEYRNLISYFISKPKLKTIKTQNIDDFYKLRSLNSSTVFNIMSSPNELMESDNEKGIKIGSKYYIPKKTLIENKQISTNNYENKIIIDFLNSIIIYIKKILNTNISDINTIKNNSNEILENEKIDIALEKKGFISTEQLTIKLAQDNIIQIHNNLETLLSNFINLSYKYKKVLVQSNDILLKPPMPTSCFLEIHHYRVIYQRIAQWFSSSLIKSEEYIKLTYFPSTDRIYEYYCLFNILDSIKQLGYEHINLDEYTSIDFQYENTKVFKFKNNDNLLTLYYEATINRKPSNDLNLFRCDSTHYKDSYYLPDFVLKFQKNEEKEKYFILDSKLIKMKNLKDYTLKDIIEKYYINILDSDLNHINLLWLMGGRKYTSKEDNIFYYYKSENNSNKKIGIVPIYPKYNNNSNIIMLKELITYFINS